MENENEKKEEAVLETASVEESLVVEKNEGDLSKIDKFFGITKYGSSMRIEVMAGFVTFLAMCYILTVNPNSILYAGTASNLWSSIFIATAIGAVIGTLLMALFAKMPFAQAPGLGLNSSVGGLIGGAVGAYSTAYNFSLANALFLVLISGVLFITLSVIPCGKNKETGKFISLREKIFDGIPLAVRKAISVGIGLFIAFIGMQNAKIITDNPYTLVQLVNLTIGDSWAAGGAARFAIVGIFSFVVIAILSHFKVKGAIIIGILAATLLAWPLGVTNIDLVAGNVEGITWKFWENFANLFKSEADGGVAFIAITDGWDMPEGSLMTCIMTVVSFSMIDMFDTMGTTVGCATNAGLIDENGKPFNYNKIMISDSVATVAGACLGTSTVTTFVESGAGIAAGGKTGLSSLVTAILFFLSIFLLPIFAFIPTAAAAGALMYVGVLMMSNVKEIDFRNPLNAVPAFLTIIMMPLTYSITTGIGIGIIAYVAMYLLVFVGQLCEFKLGKREEKPKWDLSVVCLVIFVLFLVYFLVPTTF